LRSRELARPGLATDQAGNTASTPRVVIVDNTPPETAITSAPPGEVNVAERR